MKYPYLDPELLESKRFYTRTKACTILDIDPDVLDRIILSNIQSYSKDDTSTDIVNGIFTGAEIKHAIQKYYLKFFKEQLATDLQDDVLSDLAFRAKYSSTRTDAAIILQGHDELKQLFAALPLENYYPVPKAARKH